MRTKLGAVLTIPAVAFVAVAGLQTNTSVRQAEALQQYTRQVHLSRQITALIHQLQSERDRTAGVLAGIVAGSNPADLDPAHVMATLGPDQAAADKAAQALREAARPLLADSAVNRIYTRVNAGIQQLSRVRGGVQGGWLREQAAFDAYTHTIDDLIALLPSESKIGSGGDQLGQDVRAINVLAQAKELTDQMRGRLYVLCITRQPGEQDLQTLSDLAAQRQTLLDQFRTGAPSDQLAAYDSMVHGTAVLNAERLGQRALTEARLGKLSVDPQQWWQVSASEVELIRLVEIRMLTRAVSTADARNATQWRNTLTATSIIVFILLIALLTSWVIGRSMARSLRLLREQALDVATYRLPEAIERLRTAPRGDPVIDVGDASLDSVDEIGQVANAFTAVHRSAVRLAVEQAMMRRAVNAMFVNLARRSQTLVERQLQLLDNLESAETDPDQLASLFRLDHLATRMRRNDENLLVLAGADTSRRWSEPVAMSAVVLAAMAEIEQYPRIRHDVAEDVYVVGHAVADVVHLLAELLENATTFSPPDSTVTVSGWRPEQSGGAIISIEDHGLGMSPGSLDEANRQLATPSSIDVATSERMGLLVVANLAARHRIKVALKSAEQGVLAQVGLPAQLLAPPAVHRTTGLLSRQALPTGELPAGAPGRRQMQSLGAGAVAVPRGEATVAASAPVVRTAGTPTPAPGVPVVTVAGNAASLRRTVARTVGAGVGVPVGAGVANGAGRPATLASSGSIDRVGAAGRPDAGSGPVSGAAGAPGRVSGGGGPGGAGPAASAAFPSRSGQPAGRGPAGPAVPVVPAAPPASPDLPTVRRGAAQGANGSRKPEADAGQTRRTMPARAEDILGAASSSSSSEASRWWSRTAPVEPSRPSTPAPRQPVSAGTSNAGLPIRVPMAQLPGDGSAAAQRTGDAPERVSHEPDPSQVSSMLSAFYGGVHRAAKEDGR